VRNEITPRQPEKFLQQSFTKGETFILVSALMCDYYQIIGYKETNLTLQRKVDKTPVSTMESFNLKPRFDIFPPGDRAYSIYDWKHFGGRKKANAPL